MHGLIVSKYSENFQYYHYDYMLKNTQNSEETGSKLRYYKWYNVHD